MTMNYRKLAYLLSASTVCLAVSAAEEQIVFYESFGVPDGTTVIADHAFDNADLSFSGTGDIRSSLASSGYDEASGDGNAFLTGGDNRFIAISGIDTSGFAAEDLRLSFGAYKSTTASDMTELVVSFSSDGEAFTDLTFDAQPTGSGTANWRFVSISESAVIPAVPSLTLRWLNSAESSSPQFRIDDVTLTAVPEPSVYAALFGVLALMLVLRMRRRAA